jgi:hypothetical protein
MQSIINQTRGLRTSSDNSPNPKISELFILPIIPRPEQKLKKGFLSARCLSTVSDRALYYSSLCSQHESSPCKKFDIIQEIKQKLSKVSRKSLTEKSKPKKHFFGYNLKKPLKIHEKAPELRVSQETLIKKTVKRRL